MKFAGLGFLRNIKVGKHTKENLMLTDINKLMIIVQKIQKLLCGNQISFI